MERKKKEYSYKSSMKENVKS